MDISVEKQYKLLQDCITPNLYIAKGIIDNEKFWRKTLGVVPEQYKSWFEEVFPSPVHSYNCEYNCWEKLGDNQRFNILREFLNIKYCPSCGVKL